jgi:hypothetical protein
LRPPFGLELDEALKLVPKFPFFNKENIEEFRRKFSELISSKSLALNDPETTHRDITIPGPDGDLIPAVLRLENSAGSPRLEIYFMHGAWRW